MPFSGRIKLKISKVYRIKSIKTINFFFSFNFFFFKYNMPQGIATVKNEKKKKEGRRKRRLIK